MFENDLLVLVLLIVNLLVGFGISFFIAHRRYDEYDEEIAVLEDSVNKKTRDLTKVKTTYNDLNSTTKTQISELEKRVKEGLTYIEKYKADRVKAVEIIKNLTSDVEEKNSAIDVLNAEVNMLKEANESSTTRAKEAEERVQEITVLSQAQEQEITSYKSRMLAMQDDLGHLKGIGPKVSSILRAAGVNTFAKLAATDLNRINELLMAANPTLLRLIDASTWSKQAKLAADGEWEELKRFQKEIKSDR
jgi:small subunit ribosomal protein S2